MNLGNDKDLNAINVAGNNKGITNNKTYWAWYFKIARVESNGDNNIPLCSFYEYVNNILLFQMNKKFCTEQSKYIIFFITY